MRAPDYTSMPLERLQRLALADNPNAPAAARAMADAALLLDFTYRTKDRHLGGGHYTASPLAAMADDIGGGRGGGRPDPMLVAYLNHHTESREQRRARAWLSAVGLPDRLLLAALIRAGRCDYRGHGPWSAGYRDIADNLGEYAHRLGWPAVRPLEKPYKDGKALTNAAMRAMVVLVKAAETGAYAHALKC